MRNVNKINELICLGAMGGDLSNVDLVQIIELCGSFLNIKTVTNYARDRGISYQAATKNKNKIRIFGTNFITDNA